MLRSHIKESWWGAKGTVGHLWEGGIQRHRQGKKQTITLRGGGGKPTWGRQIRTFGFENQRDRIP